MVPHHYDSVVVEAASILPADLQGYPQAILESQPLHPKAKVVLRDRHTGASQFNDGVPSCTPFEIIRRSS